MTRLINLIRRLSGGVSRPPDFADYTVRIVSADELSYSDGIRLEVVLQKHGEPVYRGYIDTGISETRESYTCVHH